MSLLKYKSKRKFSKTPKPSGKIFKKNAISSEAIRNRRSMIRGKLKKTSGLFSFVVHRHEASHLHWDLRLEMDGVLKSWAVPKEPPKEKGTKRLAIQVEDHPLEYGSFEGIIPEGNYGAGKVEIWDRGDYKLINKDDKKIEFELKGQKLKGKYVLIKTKYGNKKENSWLFFKT